MLRAARFFRDRRLPTQGFALSMGSSLMRLVIQMGQFVIVARALGPAEYGGFVALVGLCTSFSALAGWGGGLLYVRDVSRHGTSVTQGYLARMLWMFAPSSLLIGALVWCLYVAVFDAPMSAAAAAAVVLSDLVFGAFVVVSSRVLLAHDRYRSLFALETAFAGLRLCAALVFLAVGDHTAADWAVFYLLATAVSAAVAFVMIGAASAMRASPRWVGREFHDGFFLSFGSGAQMARRNMDRPLALATLGPEAAGVFAAGARFIEAALLPIFSVLRVTYRRFFSAAGADGGGVRPFLLSMLPVVGGLGLLTAAGLVALSFVIDVLLGPAYAGAGPVLAALAILPAVNGLIGLASDALAAEDRQATRMLAEVLGCAAKILLCLALAPHFGMAGLIGAVLLTDIGVALAMWTSALRRGRGANR